MLWPAAGHNAVGDDLFVSRDAVVWWTLCYKTLLRVDTEVLPYRLLGQVRESEWTTGRPSVQPSAYMRSTASSIEPTSMVFMLSDALGKREQPTPECRRMLNNKVQCCQPETGFDNWSHRPLAAQDAQGRDGSKNCQNLP